MDAGLENTIAAKTVLSRVDGQNGHLIIHGHTVEELAAKATFEETIKLLWSGFFEIPMNLDTIRQLLADARITAFELMLPLAQIMAEMAPMEAVRLALTRCPDGDGFKTALSGVAMLGVSTAAVCRLIEGKEPIAPRSDLTHAEDILSMIGHDEVDPDLARGLNAYLVTVCEHGLNASTFVARSVASTQAGLISALVGGFSALKGPLHGGAPGPVLDMLDAIGTPENAEGWIRAALERRERLMGFGHRIYRVRDPRADALKAAAHELPQSAGRLSLAQTIETTILKRLAAEKPDRSLETNVEYYTAILLEALGLPREVFTCVFGCARSVGWIAHAQEQLATRRIVRPKSIYIGPELEMTV